ncbi:hypothetical protein LguiB_009941 [Lonicera macranthoides]
MALSTSLTLFLLAILLTPSLPLRPPPDNNQLPQPAIRIPLMRVDSNENYTNLQLLQRAIHRSKKRLQRLTTMATIPPAVNNITAPVRAGDGEFLMNLSIGTPAKPFSAIMDTGSDLIWTQCSPCTKCFNQPTPVFDPKNSSTSSNITCDSELCTNLNIFKCDNGCNYLYTYGDESSTQGYMAMETFTFSGGLGQQPVSVPKLGFGCGVINLGLGFGQGSGLVGLGRGPLSLISQLNLQKFSYCLTSIGENKTSTLLLGSLADLNYNSTIGSTNGGMKMTPLIRNPSQPTFYYLSLEGITIGETLIPVSKSTFKLQEDGSGGMIIDSGTTITYLQEDTFEMVKKEFMSQMKLRVSRSDNIGLDVCFDLPSDFGGKMVVPKLKFHFKGADLELPSENYMVADPGTGVVCLAMAASGSMSIFGNVQQQNLLIIHDLERESLSFLPTQCDQL